MEAMTHERRVGVVVAGGGSRRFGPDEKALATVGGEPMLRRVVRRVGAATDAVVVNCRPAQVPGFRDALAPLDAPLAFVPDRDPGRGPVAGLLTALGAIRAQRVAAVSCDAPFLDPGLLTDLFEVLTDASVGAAVPEDPAGRAHPLRAVYRTRPAREACVAALAADQRSLHAVLERLAVERVPLAATGASDGAFVDVNTPGDLAAAREP
jgi:molybdopterin-guanine dinucleotide biosynthesis protein A